MNIFISWSGELSKEVAFAFRSWLKLVMSHVEPFMSDEDIEKGVRGLEEISSNLESANVGLICITRSNFERPWINFEAGAISKQVGKSRVIPFLIDLDKADLPQHSPLKQFQMTVNSRDDIKKMTHSINRASDDRALDASTLDRYFDAFWGELQDALDNASVNSEDDADQQGPTTGAMVAEILDVVRALLRQQESVASEQETSRYVDASWASRQRQLADYLALLADYPVGTGAISKAVTLTVDMLSDRLGRMPTPEEVLDEMIKNTWIQPMLAGPTMRAQVLDRARQAIDQATLKSDGDSPLVEENDQ